VLICTSKCLTSWNAQKFAKMNTCKIVFCRTTSWRRTILEICRKLSKSVVTKLSKLVWRKCLKLLLKGTCMEGGATWDKGWGNLGQLTTFRYAQVWCVRCMKTGLVITVIVIDKYTFYHYIVQDWYKCSVLQNVECFYCVQHTLKWQK